MVTTGEAATSPAVVSACFSPTRSAPASQTEKDAQKDAKAGAFGEDSPSPKRQSSKKNLFAGEEVVLSLREAKDAAKGLGLTNAELRRLKSQFDSIDISGDGDIDAEELLEALQERPTPLTDAIFKLIDLVGAALKTLMRADRRFILQCARRTGRQRPRLLR